MGTKYYKHPAYGHVYGVQLMSPIGRVAWPSLVKPKDPPAPLPGQAPSQPRYELTLLLPKDSDVAAKFHSDVRAMTDEMIALFNEGRPAKLGLGDARFKDGDTFDLEKYPYYKNQWAIPARNAKLPKIVDQKVKELAASEIKAGNLIRVTLTPLITAHGVSFKLDGVQLVQDDGTKFGGAISDPTALFDILDSAEPNGQTPEAPQFTPAPEVSADPVSIREKMAANVKGKKAALDKL